MKKKTSLLLVSAALILAACTGTNGPKESSSNVPPTTSSEVPSSSVPLPSSSYSKTELAGEGTVDNPYLLEEAGDFELFAKLYSSEEIDAHTYFALGNDIDFGGAKISQIAPNASHPFDGILDGRGHALKNFSLPLSSSRISGVSVINGGLFGNLSDATIIDLTLDGVTLDLDVKTAVFYGGALFAQAENSIVDRVEVKNANLSISTTSDDSALPSYGSFLGGIGGSLMLTRSSVFVLSSLSFSGSIEANHNVSVAGGLIASLSTSGLGSININNSYVNASKIKAGVYAGGLGGKSDYFVTATSVYAKANEISVLDNGGYAGGIFGFANEETFVKDAIVDVTSIKGGTDNTSTSKGAAGYVYGYGMGDYFEGIYSYFGAGSSNVYAVKGEMTGTMKNELGHFNEVVSLPSDAFAKVGLTSAYWNASSEGYPTLSGNEVLTSRTFTINPNGGTAGDVSSKTITANELGLDASAGLSVPSRDGYFFSNYYYDAEAEEHFRPYVPSFVDTTVYADWTDKDLLVGHYEATLTFGDDIVSTAKPGSIVIGDDASFVWTHDDGAQAIGGIDIYGNYFVLDLTSGDTGYDGVVAEFEDGAFTFPDAYDYSSYIYNWSRKVVDDNPYQGVWSGTNGLTLTFKDNGVVTLNDGDSDYDLAYTISDQGVLNITGSWNWGSMEVTDCSVNDKGQIVLTVMQDSEYEMTLTFTSNSAPKDYTDTGIVGDWYSNTHNSRRFNFQANGTFVLYSIYSNFEDGSGAFSVEGSSVHLYAMGSFTESDLNYDATNKVMYGYLGNTDTVEVMTQHRYVATYTGDNVAIYHFDGQDVVYLNGTYSPNSVVTGALGTDSEITITTGSEIITYTVSGTALTQKEEEGGNEGGDVVVKSIAGTWTGKVGSNNVTVTINADGTGSYAGNALTWTISGNRATATLWGYIELTATWNEAKDTLSVEYEDTEEFYTLEGTLSRAE